MRGETNDQIANRIADKYGVPEQNQEDEDAYLRSSLRLALQKGEERRRKERNTLGQGSQNILGGGTIQKMIVTVILLMTVI